MVKVFMTLKIELSKKSCCDTDITVPAYLSAANSWLDLAVTDPSAVSMYCRCVSVPILLNHKKHHIHATYHTSHPVLASKLNWTLTLPLSPGIFMYKKITCNMCTNLPSDLFILITEMSGGFTAAQACLIYKQNMYVHVEIIFSPLNQSCSLFLV